jgi:lipopolysaccharide transport system permease protein
VNSTTTVDQEDPPIVHIRVSGGWRSLGLTELWQYRGLLYFLVWRDVKVRYKQTVLGAAWAVIQPFATMVVFTLCFGKLARIPSGDVPYPLFTFAALVPWTLFANGVVLATASLVLNQGLIQKVYFPRLVVPISAVLSCVIDFAIAFAVLVGMMIWYGVTPGSRALWLPVLFLLAIASSLGVGLWLSALNVKYRDVGHIVPFLTQFWLLATPVAYPSTLLSEKWQLIYSLNPLVGVVEGFRWALLGAASGTGGELVVSTASAIVLLISGAFYFSRTERAFADII